MRKQCFLTLLSAMLLTTAAYAEKYNAEYFNCVLLKPAGGSTVILHCAERPQIVIEEEELVIKSPTTNVVLPRDTYFRMFFPKMDPDLEDAVRTASADADAHLRLGADAIVVEGLKAGTVLHVYTIDGKLVGTHTTTDEGNANMSTTNLQPGTYVLRAGSLNLKFQKR